MWHHRGGSLVLSRSADIASLQHCTCDTLSTTCAAMHNIERPGSVEPVPCSSGGGQGAAVQYSCTSRCMSCGSCTLWDPLYLVCCAVDVQGPDQQHNDVRADRQCAGCSECMGQVWRAIHKRLLCANLWCGSGCSDVPPPGGFPCAQQVSRHYKPAALYM